MKSKLENTKFTLAAMKKAIKGSGGSYAEIARRLNVSYVTVNKIKNANPIIDELIDEEKSNIIKLAEDVIYEKLREGNLSAAKFVLLNHRLANGDWFNKQEIDVNVNKVPEININFDG